MAKRDLKIFCVAFFPAFFGALLAPQCTAAQRNIVVEHAEEVCVELYEDQRILCTTGALLIEAIEDHRARKKKGRQLEDGGTD